MCRRCVMSAERLDGTSLNTLFRKRYKVTAVCIASVLLKQPSPAHSTPSGLPDYTTIFSDTSVEEIKQYTHSPRRFPCLLHRRLASISLSVTLTHTHTHGSPRKSRTQISIATNRTTSESSGESFIEGAGQG